MGTLNDENNKTHTLASGGTVSDSDALVLNTDNTGSVDIYIDNGSGGAPADYTIVVERHSPVEDRWMRYEAADVTVTGAGNPKSHNFDAVPDQLRFKITNDSAGSADYRINAVSH